MKNKQPTTAPLWPPAWQTANGLSIVDFVLSEARGRGFACTEIEATAVADPRSKNQSTIGGHRCQAPPGRVLDPDEGHGEGMLRLHPAFEWASEFLILIYVVKGLGLFILPANDAAMRGAWCIEAKAIEALPRRLESIGKGCAERPGEIEGDSWHHTAKSVAAGLARVRRFTLLHETLNVVPANLLQLHLLAERESFVQCGPNLVLCVTPSTDASGLHGSAQGIRPHPRTKSSTPLFMRLRTDPRRRRFSHPKAKPVNPKFFLPLVVTAR